MQILRRLAYLLLLSGVVLLIGPVWLEGLPQVQGVQAQDLPPRPTDTPIAPTSTPIAPTSTPEPEEDDDLDRAPHGRITGTVIDLTTGAPAHGIMVEVGDVLVISDQNGNYDRNGLAAGSYRIALKLTAAQGSAAQEAIVVDLAANATVIQHLSFRSPARIQPQPTFMLPATLPNTSGAYDGALWAWIALGLILLGGSMRLRR